MPDFDVRSVAVIGAGPGGLAALYELLHTSRDGRSSVGGEKSSDPCFTNVVAFEQKPSIGGLWAPTNFHRDPGFPPQEILDSERYNDPDVIDPKKQCPKELDKTSPDNPLTKKVDEGKMLDWDGSGVFPELFSNVPSRFMRFSYIPNENGYLNRNRLIYPFVTLSEINTRLSTFVEREGLSQHVRLRSKVEDVSKNLQGKWTLTIREKCEKDGVEKWYKDEFDAVILAVGHYCVPHIPLIKGLSDFNKVNPGILMHAKAFRSREIFRNKKVLIMGSNLSSTNLLQYSVPLASQTFISKRGSNTLFPWIDRAVQSKGILMKPGIKEINALDGEITFADDSKEKDFDLIVLATGYHYHYPFMNGIVKTSAASHSSRVEGFYYNTFFIEDPTLAAVGVTVSPITFHSIEASAAAICGVWSNSKRLPSKDEQREWEIRRIQETGDSIRFHYYFPRDIKEKFFDEIFRFSPQGRYHPFKNEAVHLSEVDDGVNSIENLFYKLKDKQVGVEETYNFH